MAAIGKAFKIGLGYISFRAITGFVKATTSLASDLTEVQNVVDVTFGEMAKDINDFASTAIEQFGLSELNAKKFSSSMGAMLKSSGIAGEAVRDMAINLTKLSADMASFYNLDNEEMFKKIMSGMSGMATPLKELGINMNIANIEAFAMSQGVNKAWREMSQAEQTMWRYNYLLHVTKDAQGDFARNAHTWANQTKILRQQFEILKGTIGAGFVNILMPVVKGLNTLIKKIQIAAEYFKAFTRLIFGDAEASSQGGVVVETMADNLGDVEDGFGDVGKAAKKAAQDVKKSLAPFDQLNILADKTSKSAEELADELSIGNVGNVGVDFGKTDDKEIDIKINTSAFDKVIEKAKETAEFLKNVFAPPLEEAINKAKPLLYEWKETLLETFSDFATLGEPIKNWMINDLVPVLQQGIGFIGEVFAWFLESTLMKFETFKEAVFPIIEWFAVDGLPLLTSFASGAIDVFSSLFDVAKTIYEDLWKSVVDPTLKLISQITVDVLDKIKEFWDKFGGGIIDGITTALDKLKEIWTTFFDAFLKPFVDKALEMLKMVWDNHLKALVEEVLNFVGKLITAALDILNEFVLPLVHEIVEVLAPAFKEAFDFVIDVIGSALGGIIDAATGIIKALGGIIDFIAGIFTGDWERAWEGVKTVFEGIFDAVIGIFKGAINILIDSVNFLIRSMNKISFDVPDWVPGIGGKNFGINIPEIPKLAKG
ncbi:MAG TPA: hypothetical protein PK723_04795, partial [Candidatus Pacearchaeota archaeon]|nr:hypothetical protein [Candidatus Pacearchaeota archaeon]